MIQRLAEPFYAGANSPLTKFDCRFYIARLKRHGRTINHQEKEAAYIGQGGPVPVLK